MKRLLLFFMALSVMMSVHADVVTADQAKAMAREFISQGGTRFKAGPGIPLNLAHEARSLDGKPDYYVFNNGVDGGYIVVSGDDRTIPVLGYSTRGTFDYESLPDNAKWWFSEYQRQLQYLRDHPEVKPRQAVTLSSSVDALVKTRWDQDNPYNYCCPTAYDKLDVNTTHYGDRACTGCVATALAQIMCYHKWPISGTGSNTYDATIKGYMASGSQEEVDRVERLTADFNRSVYTWSVMKRGYKAYKASDGQIKYQYQEDDGTWVEAENHGVTNYIPLYQVSKLMKDVGYAVEMKYGSPGRGGSGVPPTSLYKVKNAMIDFFHYHAQLFARNDNPDNWDEMLRNELNAGRPIFYQGLPEYGNDGHAFVFDGYNNQGYFHINWGLGGDYDGEYLSSLLNPGPYDFSYSQASIFLTPLNGQYSETPTKTLSVAMPNGNAGKVKKGGVMAYLPFTVYGVHLDRDVTFSLAGANADQFVLPRSSVSAAEANEGISCGVCYMPNTGGNHKAQLKVSSGNDVEPVILDLTGRSVVYYDVDGDETVTINDLTALIRSVLSGSAVGYTDQSISIADVTDLARVLLAGTTELNINDGLVAYYPFNGDARDASGHGNDGIVNNVSLTTGTFGEPNGAYQFGGYYNPGFIRIPNSESLQFTDGFSFACFVKITDWSGMDGYGRYSNNTVSGAHAVHCIFAKDHDQRGPTMLATLNDDLNMSVRLATFRSQSQWCELNSTTKVHSNKLNEWVHIAVTYRNNEARMYVNGALVDQRRVTPNYTDMNSRDLYLGRFSATWYPLNGVLDEVRVYNRALSSIEVAALAEGSEQTFTETHPFSLSQRSVELTLGESVTIDMLNGTGSYSVGSDSGIVDFTLDRENECITLRGMGTGTTNVTVIDVNTQTTIQLPVTVTPSSSQPATETFTVGGVSFKMIAVEGGTFMMGVDINDYSEDWNDEKPAHQVTVSSFKIGQTEVTQALWLKVMGSNPSYFTGDLNCPVEMVSWNDCQAFITKLNEMTGRRFRLPTEAEWAFAANGGNLSHGYKFSGSDDINEVAWYHSNSDLMTHPVATKKPNELGLFDMSGNVWEWIQDWWSYFSSEPQVNPTGPESGSERVIRGGACESIPRSCLVLDRWMRNPSLATYIFGLRLALD